MTSFNSEAVRHNQEAAIEIVAYDPGWPAMFEVERLRLQEVLAPWLAAGIEHIGSTAVPMLPAKPVIDIMAPVHTLQASRDAIEALGRAGYLYCPYKPDLMHWFCKPGPTKRTHHLHLVPIGSSLWRERLAFRDALRSSPKLANDYAALKTRLAAQFRLDREAYTDAKTPFVQMVLCGAPMGQEKCRPGN